MNIWWSLRKLWHMPEFWHEAMPPIRMVLVEPCDYVDESYRGLWRRRWYLIKLAWNHGKLGRRLLHDLFVYCVIAKRKLLWWQPFRCNGNAGGWRTDLCEWLEYKARVHDDASEL